MTEAFEGSGVQNGMWVQSQKDGSFTYTVDSVFMRDVEALGPDRACVSV